MNPSESKSIDENMPILQERSDIDALTTFFHAHGAIKYNKFKSFHELRFPSTDDRVAAFFEAIKGIDNGWNLLGQCLKENKQAWLWHKLLESKQKKDQRNTQTNANPANQRQGIFSYLNS